MIENKIIQIIVPFYNDFDNFVRFNELLDEVDTKEIAFLFLDNGSHNNDIEEFFNSKNYLNRQLIVTKKNLGYGGGIIYSSKYIDNDFIAWMPGNLKINPKDAIIFFKKEIKNLSRDVLIKAKRIERKPLDYIKTNLFGILSSFYFATNLTDAGGTPSIVHKSFFNNTENYPLDFSFDVFVYYYFRKKHLRIKRPRIRYTKRHAGKSHWQKGITSEINLTLKIFSYKSQWLTILSKK